MNCIIGFGAVEVRSGVNVRNEFEIKFKKLISISNNRALKINDYRRSRATTIEIQT